MKFDKILISIGIIIHLGFGIWHFFVPELYGWFDYMSTMPLELTNGISATNFFLALSLVLLGLWTSVVVVKQWDNKSSVTTSLSLMSILWIFRCAYQIILPQGTMIPNLPSVLLVIFSATTLCFVVPLVRQLRIVEPQ